MVLKKKSLLIILLAFLNLLFKFIGLLLKVIFLCLLRIRDDLKIISLVILLCFLQSMMDLRFLLLGLLSRRSLNAIHGISLSIVLLAWRWKSHLLITFKGLVINSGFKALFPEEFWLVGMLLVFLILFLMIDRCLVYLFLRLHRLGNLRRFL